MDWMYKEPVLLLDADKHGRNMNEAVLTHLQRIDQWIPHEIWSYWIWKNFCASPESRQEIVVKVIEIVNERSRWTYEFDDMGHFVASMSDKAFQRHCKDLVQTHVGHQVDWDTAPGDLKEHASRPVYRMRVHGDYHEVPECPEGTMEELQAIYDELEDFDQEAFKEYIQLTPGPYANAQEEKKALREDQKKFLDELKDFIEDIEDGREDPDEYREALELWTVDAWLYQELDREGENVFENCYWGRETSGQHIALDGPIQRIADQNLPTV